jgi:peptide/nickel transport system permease protein
MARYMLARLLRAAGTMWLVVTLVFVGLRLSGDPAAALLGPEANPEAIEGLRRAWGLDQPLPVQYARYLSNLAQGDFGRSLREQRPATSVVHERLPATIHLAAVAMILAIAIGIPAGILAALRRGSLLDRSVMAGAMLGQGLPNFVLGLVLILIFAFYLGWLPSGGHQGARSLVLPALTLSTYGIASLARFNRSAVLDVLGQDYLRTAKAKGLPMT